ncbi:MAG: 3'-5' exonuclease [Bacterioplanes sp.]|nr:3'-5' exonuclease [Bacterioplanes sp.]
MLYLGPDRSNNEQKPVVIKDWSAYYAQQAQRVSHSLLQQFYAQGMVAGDTPISDVPLMAMDFETTGLNPQTHGIVSIGLVPFTLQRIFCSRARQWLLKPRYQLTDDSITVHRITHSAVENAPDLADILPELLSLLAGHVVVVHYKHIERSFLDLGVKTRLGEGIQFPVIDTLMLEAKLHRQKPLSLWDRWRGKTPLSIRLHDSRQRYHLPPYRPHHAVTDAIASAELLQAQIAHRYHPQAPVSDFWC